MSLPGENGGQARHVGGRGLGAEPLHGEGGVDAAELEVFVSRERLDPAARLQRARVGQEMARRLEHELRRRGRGPDEPEPAVGEHDSGALGRPGDPGQRAGREVPHAEEREAGDRMDKGDEVEDRVRGMRVGVGMCGCAAWDGLRGEIYSSGASK
uniref:Uncharacterized protein n=1 Tax=Triticum urartu TaxID=4572 RepID=A0A8R7PUR7_TRIUA